MVDGRPHCSPERADAEAVKRPPVPAVVLICVAAAVIAIAGTVIVRDRAGGRGEAAVALSTGATLAPQEAQSVLPPPDEPPSEASLLNATVPYRCFAGPPEWLTLSNGRANGADGIGGVIVTATTSGDINGDGEPEVMIAMRESCGGESGAATIVVKSLRELNQPQALATITPTQLRPIGEVLEMEVRPAFRLEVRGRINEFRITGGRLEAFTAPTPPKQYLFTGGTFRPIGDL